MDISKERFYTVKGEAEDRYKGIGKVYCPYFKEEIAFNAKGLEHIKFKEKDKARLVIDQYIRLRLLKLAPQIISKSHTLQEFFETKRFEKQKINSRWENRLIQVVYYGFVAIINGARIKVIVKEVEGGSKFFWSIIPFWKNDKKNSQNKKILHAGDMEYD
ncbi:MAG: hypothetical protein A3C84_04975 [Candidatus Ryanbacteria bacterium RIFCSPHIGHO2_02_FULL_48_12]|uniref:Uncharacterized protein n=1 Tax=Candidatus Ryanbacteria bacterium RIFCSPHIGHO2_01_FULL_48_27 TaxID=1802115 RepID=A0A1G2G7V9_9BACT|nr:MAG: hypothetical protein A2756_06150 [Candidatus Ryanbacteria bacterium RIFCSPHIGHO2_01_FULL_48_27]OGZ49519.1 MAG: hypothetical protein A3C84_04975 [Candidatus Ryanbacteria bacterium RIFCSPHIGHO2_02_FULL_48_12]